MPKTYGFKIHDFSRDGVLMTIEGFKTSSERDDAMLEVLEDLPWQCSLNAEPTEENLH